MLFLAVPMRTRVYVDGFNLYYGALKGTPFKWLNLVEPQRARGILPRTRLRRGLIRPAGESALAGKPWGRRLSSRRKRSGRASAPATPGWRVVTPVGMHSERPLNIVARETSRGSRGPRRAPGAEGSSCGTPESAPIRRRPWERRLSSRRIGAVWALAPATSGWRVGTAVGMPGERLLNRVARETSRGQQGNAPCSGRGRSLVRKTGVGAYKTPFPGGACKTPPPWERRLSSRRIGAVWALAPATSGWRGGTPVGMPGERPLNMVARETLRGREGPRRAPGGKGVSRGWPEAAPIRRRSRVGAYKTPLPREGGSSGGSILDRLPGL